MYMGTTPNVIQVKIVNDLLDITFNNQIVNDLLDITFNNQIKKLYRHTSIVIDTFYQSADV